MKLNQIIRQFRFDKRLVEWNLNNKVVSQKEYKEYLKSLADDSKAWQDMVSSAPPSAKKEDRLSPSDEEGGAFSSSPPSAG